MKQRHLIQLAFGVCVASFTSTGLVHAQDFVEPSSVVSSPQRYWAKEIAFQDRLIETPSGKTQAINDRNFYSFKVAVIGTCYADQACYEKLKGLRLDQEYLFAGTVLERRGKYYVITRNVDALYKEPKAAVVPIGKAIGPVAVQELARHRNLQIMADMMNRAQASMLLYSRQQRIDFKEFFNPDSPHQDAMNQIILGVVNQLEREGRMNASELISSYIRDALSDHYMGTTSGVVDVAIPAEMLKEINAVSPPQTTTAPENPANEPAPDTNAKPVPPPPSPLPIAITTNDPPIVVEGTVPTVNPPPDTMKPVPAAPPVESIVGNEPDEVLEKLLNDVGTPATNTASTLTPEPVVPAPPPDAVVPAPAPEVIPAVVTPEPTPAPEVVVPAPVPEVIPPVVTPEPTPAPEVVVPAPAPEVIPPVVTPEPTPAPEVVVPAPAPEVIPPVVTPEPEPAPEVVVPAPAPEVPPVVTPEPTPAPEVIPPVVIPEPAPAPEVVVPAPAPEVIPPVVTPEPTPAPEVVVPASAPEVIPRVVTPEPEPAPEVVVPAPAPEVPPVVTPEPAPAPEVPPVVTPEPMPAPEVVVPAPAPEVPPVVTPEPAPAPEVPPVVTPEPAPEPAPAPSPETPPVITTIPEPVPAEKVIPPAAPAPKDEPAPKKRGFFSRVFGGEEKPGIVEPVPPPKEPSKEPGADKPVEPKPAPVVRIPDSEKMPKPPRKPEPAPEVKPPQPPPVAKPADEGVYDPDVDFHFKNLPGLPK